jgi:phage terminase small subunit
MAKLNPKQELFCQEYLKDLSATAAAKRAGYSEKTAHSCGPRLMEHAGVKARIQELMDKRSSKLQITVEKVLKDLEDCRIKCMQGEPVLDHQGNPTGEWKFEAHAAIRASELQGKHIKMFTDKLEHSFSEGLAEKLSKARKRAGR